MTAPRHDQWAVSPTLWQRLIAVVIVLAAVRGLLAALHGLELYPDSTRYRFTTDQLSSLQEGNDALHFLVTLVNLLPAPLTAGIQGLVAGIAWGFVALVVAGGARTRLLAVTGAGLVLLLSVMPWIQQWDTAALTEAFMFSGCLIAVAGGFLCVNPYARSMFGKRSVQVAAGALIGGSVFAICSHGVVVVLLAPFAVGVWWFSRRLGLIPGHRIGTRLVIGILAIVSLAAAVTSVAQADDISGWYAQNRFALRGDPAYWEFAQAHGMPSCPELIRELKTADENVRMELARTPPCPAVAEWFDQGGVSPLAELTGLPGRTLSTYVGDLNNQWTPPMLPTWSIVNASDPTGAINWVKVFTLVPIVILLLNAIAIAVIVTAAIRLRDAVGQRITTLAPGIVYAWLLALGAGYCVVTWLQDPMEINRHALPATISVSVAALLVIAHLAFVKVGDRSSEPTADPPLDEPGRAVGNL